MHHFYHQIKMKIYLQDHNMVQIKEYFVVGKYYSGYIIKFLIILNGSYHCHFFSQRQ